MTFSKLTMATAAAALALSACASNDTMMADKGASADQAGVDSPVITETPGDPYTTNVMSSDTEAGSTSGDTVMVGNAPMYSDRNVVQNASTADNLTTLVAAVQAAGLVETLEGPGPFTIFAPVNSAFDALPAGTVDTLLQPENKADLQGVLTYHVVPGTLDSGAIVNQIGGNLSTTLTTVQGGNLTISPAGDDIYVIDSKGNAARVIQSDVYQSNGVVHVIDGVLLP